MAISASLGEARLVAVDGGALSYRERGTGRPVLFVHGIFANADLFRDVVPLLADGFRCIAPDFPYGSHERALAPGTDLSPRALARQIDRVLERLELRDAILVANDTGTAFATIALAHHPERIGAAVLTNGDVFEHFFPQPLTALPRLARLPGVVAGLTATLRTDLGGRAYLRNVVRRMPPPEIRRSYLGATSDPAIRRDLEAVLRGVDARATIEAAAHFASFPRPVAVGWGADDAVFGPALGRRLAAAFPNATLRAVPKARIFVPEDDPAAVAALVREVADRT